jgi:hypothetical protein
VDESVAVLGVRLLSLLVRKGQMERSAAGGWLGAWAGLHRCVRGSWVDAEGQSPVACRFARCGW